MTKAQAGSLGGKATVKKHGREHMRNLNQLWHKKYKWAKLGTSDFALVNRQTGQPTGKTMRGRETWTM